MKRLALWFWNEPSFTVRFLAAMAVLMPLAFLIKWAA